MIVIWQYNLVNLNESVLPFCDKSHENKKGTERGGYWTFTEMCIDGLINVNL